MSISKTEIVSALKEHLPGQSAHSKLLPPGRVLKAAPHDSNRVKDSSVLLLLYEEGDELNVLLIKRPDHMKHHAGQIALPGGRIEAGESPEQTAIRETFEEIGVQVDQIEVLGRLSEFYVEVSRFQIHPVVGWLKSKPVIDMNPNEVEKVLCFPIRKFKPPYDSIELETITGRLDVPCIKYEKEIIWGATAMILSEFYDLLMEIEPNQS